MGEDEIVRRAAAAQLALILGLHVADCLDALERIESRGLISFAEKSTREKATKH